MSTTAHSPVLQLLQSLAIRGDLLNRLVDAYEYGTPSTDIRIDEPEILHALTTILEQHARPSHQDIMRNALHASVHAQPARMASLLQNLADILLDQDLFEILHYGISQPKHTGKHTLESIPHSAESSGINNSDNSTLEKNDISKSDDVSYPSNRENMTVRFKDSTSYTTPTKSNQAVNTQANAQNAHDGGIIRFIEQYSDHTTKSTAEGQPFPATNTNKRGITSYKENHGTYVSFDTGFVCFGMSLMLRWGGSGAHHLNVQTIIQSDELGNNSNGNDVDQLLAANHHSFDYEFSPIASRSHRKTNENYPQLEHLQYHESLQMSGTGQGRQRELFQLVNMNHYDDTSPVSVGDHIGIQCKKTGQFLLHNVRSGTVELGHALSKQHQWTVVTPLSIALSRYINGFNESIPHSKGVAQRSRIRSLSAILWGALPKDQQQLLQTDIQIPPHLIRHCERFLFQSYSSSVNDESMYLSYDPDSNELRLLPIPTQTNEAIDQAYAGILATEWSSLLSSRRIRSPISATYIYQLKQGQLDCSQVHPLPSSTPGMYSSNPAEESLICAPLWCCVQPASGFAADWYFVRSFLMGISSIPENATMQPPIALPQSKHAGPSDTALRGLSPLSKHPLPIQEAILVEDCLDALLGLSGRYVVSTLSSNDTETANNLAHSLALSPVHRRVDSKRNASTKTHNSNNKFEMANIYRGATGSTECIPRIGTHPINDIQFMLICDSDNYSPQVKSLHVPDPALAELVRRILPLARHFVRTQWFIERRARAESGLVGQALASAARVILREFMLVIAQLEHASRQPVMDRSSGMTNALPLSLQTLWFHLQRPFRTLSALDTILSEAPDAVGGELINLLHKAYRTCGDDMSREMVYFLLQRACQPFLRQLERWIFAGVVEDARAEFMVCHTTASSDSSQSNQSIPSTTLSMTKTKQDIDAENARLWNTRYQIRQRHVPAFLQALQEPILTTGKYLNALHHCGLQSSAVHVPSAVRIKFSVDERDYVPIVQDAYDWAARRFLRYLIDDADLFSRLDSVKTYFFMSSGDYATQFMDVAEKELDKPVDVSIGLGLSALGRRRSNITQEEQRTTALAARDAVSLQRLRSLLELSVRTSVTALDKYKDDLTCHLAPKALLDSVASIDLQTGHMIHTSEQRSSATSGLPLRGFSSITLDYTASWPISLVLSEASLVKYQVLFRHLFFCKHVERQVTRCWIAHQECKELDLRATLARSYALRQRMLHVLQNIVYYMTFEVIEPRWHAMIRKIRTAKTVDEVIRIHIDCLNTCLEECLLTDRELLKLLTKLTTLCLLFSNQITTAIDGNRLSDEEIDQRAGITPEIRNEMRKRRLERERRHREGFGLGERTRHSPTSARGPRKSIFATEEERSSITDSDTPIALLSDTQLRQRRLDVQTDAMQHTMAQQGWQAMIRKSGRLFDALLKEFMSRLLAKSAKHYESHLANFCVRLDYNGFYTQHLNLGATEQGSKSQE